MIVLALLTPVGCNPGSDRADLFHVCRDLRAGSSIPPDVTTAAKQRTAGHSWSDEQARRFYVCEAIAIGERDAIWRAEGRSAEDRARLAFEVRRNARLISREMMFNRSTVDELRERDREKYGNPDGPTFEYLMDRAEEQGLQGDARFESIVRSAQRTNPARNRRFGVSP